MLIKDAEDIIKSADFDPSEDYIVSIPFIQLYDDDQYTYTAPEVEGWRYLNKK